MRVAVRTFAKVLYWNLIAAVILIGLGSTAILRRSHEVDRLVIEYSRHHSLDPRLVSSLIFAESRFDLYALSDAGAMGLMQLMWPMAEAWAEAEGVENLSRPDVFEPETNIRAGTWALAHARDYWETRKDDPLPYMLAEYNAGRKTTMRWAEGVRDEEEFWNNMTYGTVQKYVRDILERYRGGI